MVFLSRGAPAGSWSSEQKGRPFVPLPPLLFCVAVHILCLRPSLPPARNCSHGPDSPPCRSLLCGEEGDARGAIPTARSTPSPRRTYCWDYNRSKCTYGCARLPPFLTSRPDGFVFYSLYPPNPPRCLVFLPATRIKMRLRPLFSSQSKGMANFQQRGGGLFKTFCRMPLLSLTDLGQFGKRHFFFLFFVQICQSPGNGSN